jgi:hypothetical protein
VGRGGEFLCSFEIGEREIAKGMMDWGILFLLSGMDVIFLGSGGQRDFVDRNDNYLESVLILIRCECNDDCSEKSASAVLSC